VGAERPTRAIQLACRAEQTVDNLDQISARPREEGACASRDQETTVRTLDSDWSDQSVTPAPRRGGVIPKRHVIVRGRPGSGPFDTLCGRSLGGRTGDRAVFPVTCRVCRRKAGLLADDLEAAADAARRGEIRTNVPYPAGGAVLTARRGGG